MSKELVLNAIQDVCRSVFKRDDLQITEATNANDVAEWDSVTNLFLIDQLEQRFKIKFSLMDIMNAQNVGELAQIVIQNNGVV